LGNFNVGAYGVVLRILNGYIVATAPEFGITISKRFDEIRKSEEIGALYLDLLKKVTEEIQKRQRLKQNIPQAKPPIELTPKGDPASLTVRDVASMLQISQATVRRLVEDKKLKCTVTRGSHRRFRYSEIEAYILNYNVSLLSPLSIGLGEIEEDRIPSSVRT
jgi:excisionase family DNA binding protein